MNLEVRRSQEVRQLLERPEDQQAPPHRGVLVSPPQRRQ
jgi:hypothetical protein